MLHYNVWRGTRWRRTSLPFLRRLLCHVDGLPAADTRQVQPVLSENIPHHFSLSNFGRIDWMTGTGWAGGSRKVVWGMRGSSAAFGKGPDTLSQACWQMSLSTENGVKVKI